MIGKFWDRDDTTIYDPQITKLVSRMNEVQPSDPEYTKLLVCVERLNEVKSKAARKPMVSPDVIATVAGNLLVVLAIIGYEQKHAMVSKAMAFVRPLK